MNKHTPAPWIVDEVNTPFGISYCVTHHWHETVVDGTKMGETHTDEIADLVMDYSDPETPLANARLLASAPDLLAALELCVNQLRSTITDHGSERRAIEAIRSASRAIKLARDGQL